MKINETTLLYEKLTEAETEELFRMAESCVFGVVPDMTHGLLAPWLAAFTKFSS